MAFRVTWYATHLAACSATWRTWQSYTWTTPSWADCPRRWRVSHNWRCWTSALWRAWCVPAVKLLWYLGMRTGHGDSGWQDRRLGWTVNVSADLLLRFSWGNLLHSVLLLLLQRHELRDLGFLYESTTPNETVPSCLAYAWMHFVPHRYMIMSCTWAKAQRCENCRLSMCQITLTITNLWFMLCK